MFRFQPYLKFNGECEAAFTAYARWFDGAITSMIRYRESPMAEQASPDLGDAILHATLTVGDSAIGGADTAPDRYERPRGFEVMVNLDDIDRAERIFSALADGGEVKVPMQQTFWARRFGTVVDRFGTPWTINCGDHA